MASGTPVVTRGPTQIPPRERARPYALEDGETFRWVVEIDGTQRLQRALESINRRRGSD